MTPGLPMWTRSVNDGEDVVKDGERESACREVDVTGGTASGQCSRYK